MISPKPLFIKFSHNLAYNPSKHGIFFIYNLKNQTCNSFSHCREIFDGDFNNNTEFVGFYCAGLDIKRLNKFFQEVEKNLGIKGKDKTILFGTNLNKPVVICKVSKFWVPSRTYRGIFTMLLRCGCVYYENDFNASLLKYNLTKPIIDPLKYFLAGNIKFAFKKLGHGVYEHFKGLKGNQIMEQMVNPHADKLEEREVKDIW